MDEVFGTSESTVLPSTEPPATGYRESQSVGDAESLSL